MNFWVILLIINLCIAFADLVLVYSSAIAIARAIKSQPNYRAVKRSVAERVFNCLETFVKALLPLYNVLLLLGLLFADSETVKQKAIARYYSELGE